MWQYFMETLLPEELRQVIVAQTAPVTQVSPGVIVLGLLLSGLSFLITWAIGKPILVWLRAKKFGKLEREDGLQSYQKKSGTPTMGGIMMTVSILIVSVSFILIPLVVQTGRGL